MSSAASFGPSPGLRIAPCNPPHRLGGRTSSCSGTCPRWQVCAWTSSRATEPPTCSLASPRCAWSGRSTRQASTVSSTPSSTSSCNRCSVASCVSPMPTPPTWPSAASASWAVWRMPRPCCGRRPVQAPRSPFAASHRHCSPPRAAGTPATSRGSGRLWRRRRGRGAAGSWALLADRVRSSLCSALAMPPRPPAPCSTCAVLASPTPPSRGWPLVWIRRRRMVPGWVDEPILSRRGLRTAFP
mmetsp:Transcript_59019/g.192516  ORF Transcript_59019/g.192516 Transcript_59019/m.192516 type:complete len:242 (-) Transcript_59019:985-1710(-)